MCLCLLHALRLHISKWHAAEDAVISVWSERVSGVAVLTQHILKVRKGNNNYVSVALGFGFNYACFYAFVEKDRQTEQPTQQRILPNVDVYVVTSIIK